MRRHIPRLLSSFRPRPSTLSATRPTLIYNEIRCSSTSTATPDPSESQIPSLFTPSGEPSSSKPFYVTTPIFYVNASPHIGHLHSLLLTDVLARFSRLRRPDRKVIFATGTDEHGMKIQQAAKARGIGEQEFCDDVSERFRDLAKLANASNTDFIRTTEKRHQKAVEHFWQKLVDRGDIYKGTHSGWYSISDESFYAASQVTKRDSDGVIVALESGNEVIWEEETNWKFRLSAYKGFLNEWLSKPESVHPPSVRQHLLSQINSLEDLSVSRPKSRVKWGIPVPNDPDQSIYVWVDALINYLTVTGYPAPDEGWPADVHVVGKDITKFHAIHWPALLASASLSPPRRVIAHAHWTMGKSKMSKSKGNVVDPIQAMRDWSVDGVRWYLMRVGGSLTDDADYAPDQVEVHYRILADQFGNLLSRISGSKMLKKATRDLNLVTPESQDRDEELDRLLSGLRDEFENKMEVYGVSGACQTVMDVIAATNKLFTDLKPWSAEDGTKAIIYAYHSLRISSILLQPIIPTKSIEALDRLGVPSEQRTWNDAVWPQIKQISTEEVVERLKQGGREWKGKGHLFPLPDRGKQNLAE
ncbi:methionine-tRNA ligase [Kwoniella mangroviensis CBS 8886]|uniref:methionine-tRNA ligase n=1 Tax=Kwoniella mangroviensis CBS 8507 TaxID=1296122 RepID=UPI00080CCC0B|nr:methionine-tRNA ligase [Kwoniella mangroviensis CBS 8507]OCF70549.1 methionine-tRNA ligase [Kwoniella mangroviensis CBS 8507]OCF76328.1 methionine-tRNA ligase [Kwoniella mangroviensis CBS 8886]